MKSKKTKVLVIILCLTMVYMSTVYAATGFSEETTQTNSIFSLPSNGVKGLFSEGIVSGNTVTNKPTNSGFEDGVSNWTALGAASIEETTNIFKGTKARKFIYSSYTGSIVQNISAVEGRKYYCSIWVYIDSVTTIGDIGLFTYDNGESVGTVKVSVDNSITGSWQRINYIHTVGAGKPSFTFRFGNYNSNSTATLIFDCAMVVDLTELGLDNLTASQAADRFHWIDGTKSTNCGIIKTVTKNLFSGFELGGISLATGNTEAATNCLYSKDYITVKNNTQYVFSDSEQQGAGLRNIQYVLQYDAKKMYLGYVILTNTPITFTTNSNTKYIRTRSQTIGAGGFTIGDYLNYETQLEKGTTATAYVKYDLGEVFCPETLRSVPNGTADIFNILTGLHTKNVDVVTLDGNSGWGTWGEDANFVQMAIIAWKDNNNSVRFTQGTSSTAAKAYNNDYNSFIISALVGDGEPRLHVTAGGVLYLSFSKVAHPTITDSTSFKAYLDNNPITLTYQLATPEITTYNTAPLACYENGTVMVLPQVKESAAYNNGISTTNIDLPIKSLVRVDKIENGILTPVDLSNATIAPDGLSITISGAVNGETYIYVYEYAFELSTIPTITYSVPINQDGQITGNTNAIQRHSDLIDIILQQIQLMRQEIQELKTMLQ